MLPFLKGNSSGTGIKYSRQLIVERPPSNHNNIYLKSLVMGNRASRGRQPPFNPTTSGWELREKGQEYNVWRHPQTGEEIEEYRRVFSDQRQFDHERDMFSYRLESDMLVASRFFREETQRDMCSTFYKGSVYLERIPVRLAQINEIPFPDVLHLYHQAFRGFSKLFDKVGYFDPTEGMIGINQQGRVKIWLNDNLSKGLPQMFFGEGDRSEASMVRNVVNLIQLNTDLSTLPENIVDAMRANSVSTFREADNVLQLLATRHGQTIPNQLDCVLEMQPGLFSRVSADGEPSVTLVQGAVTQQPIGLSNVQVGVPQGMQYSLPMVNTAAFPSASVNRTMPVAFPTRNFQPQVIPQPRQAMTLPNKPVSAISLNQRAAIPASNPTSVSYIQAPTVKPLTAGFYSNRSAQVSGPASNVSSRNSVTPVPGRRPAQLPVIQEQPYRLAPQVRPRNQTVVRGTPAPRGVRTTTQPQPTGQIQIKLESPKVTTLPSTAIGATTSATYGANYSAATMTNTIYQVDSKSKDIEYTSPEIMQYLGIKPVEQPMSTTIYETGRTQTLGSATELPKAQPITHTVTFEEDFEKATNIRFNYAPDTLQKELPPTARYEQFTVPVSSVVETKIASAPKIEFTYSATVIPRNDYTSTIRLSETVVAPSRVEEPSVTPVYHPVQPRQTTLTEENYMKIKEDFMNFHTAYTSGTDYVSSLTNNIGSTGLGYTSYAGTNGEGSYGTTYLGSFGTTSKVDAIDGYTSYKSEFNSGVDVPASGSRLATTMAGINNSPSKTVTRDITSYEVREYETTTTGYTNYKSTEEIYKVTESFMASGSYTPAIASIGTAPLSFSNYNYTSTLPTTPLSNFGTFATSISSPVVESASFGGAAGRQQSSYDAHLDNELMKDLERLRTGTLQKPSEINPVPPISGEFVSTLSFGANSEYIRDSIRSGFSK